MSYALCLFLTRVAVSALVIVAISVLGLGFPFEPAHVGQTYLTAGLPAFFLLLWARPEQQPKDLLWPLVRFVLPAAILTMLFGVALYVGFYMQVLSRVQTIEPPAEVASTGFEAFYRIDLGTDEAFGPAVATVVAQTMLVLPDPDRLRACPLSRPANPLLHRLDGLPRRQAPRLHGFRPLRRASRHR